MLLSASFDNLQHQLERNKYAGRIVRIAEIKEIQIIRDRVENVLSDQKAALLPAGVKPNIRAAGKPERSLVF